MSRQLLGLFKTTPTDLALIRGITRMYPHVYAHVPRRDERLLTYVALVEFVAFVGHLVPLQHLWRSEAFATFAANEIPVGGVRPAML